MRSSSPLKMISFRSVFTTASLYSSSTTSISEFWQKRNKPEMNDLDAHVVNKMMNVWVYYTVDIKIRVCNKEQLVFRLHSIRHLYSLKETKVLKKRRFCQIVQLKVSSFKDIFFSKFDFVCLREELKSSC